MVGKWMEVQRMTVVCLILQEDAGTVGRPSGPGGLRAIAAGAQCVLQPARAWLWGWEWGRYGYWSVSRERIEHELHPSGAAAVYVVELSCDQVDKEHSTKGQSCFGALRTSVFQSGKAMRAPFPLFNSIPLGERLVDR